MILEKLERGRNFTPKNEMPGRFFTSCRAFLYLWKPKSGCSTFFAHFKFDLPDKFNGHARHISNN